MEQEAIMILTFMMGMLIGMFLVKIFRLLNGVLIINRYEQKEYKMLKLKYAEFKNRVP